MKKLHYTQFINASREKVWRTMLDDVTYRQWTAVFNPGGSYYEGDWSVGSKMRFLGPDPKTGKVGGMLSYIRENRPYEYLSMEHVGMINDGVEDTQSDAVKKWTPAFENYTFIEKDGGTEVQVDIDIADEFQAEFDDMWPKSLQALKKLAEA